MPPAGEPAGTPLGLLLDIGGVVHRTGIHLAGRLAETEPCMTAVQVPQDDPAAAINTARDLLGLGPR
jgi:hypothetical protein